MEQFTYSSLKSPMNRDEMLQEKMVRLGTQSGNYGAFQEQARVLTLKGAIEIRQELSHLAAALGHDVSAVFELTPTLEKLLK